MRVIAGKFRSRKLATPPGVTTRPTSDRLRETLFNVLAPALADTVFLDLYAGSGAVGIEALSRGARQVYFAESDRKAARAIRDNLKSLRLEEGVELLEREVMPAVRLLDAQAVRCDIVFLDPPYGAHGAYEQVLGFLSQSRLLHAETIVIAEHDKHFDPGNTMGALARYRTLKQGDAVLSFYRLAATSHD
ncbi:MAG TPA: 16S rRNA (guanine(966)-N(2))-methyltransferase RsmD [Terriglobales bacterium]|nr:16S rRNA (guanine(966)-N(2))-methyltransferase RsmD [Terriglobales bacterium]